MAHNLWLCLFLAGFTAACDDSPNPFPAEPDSAGIIDDIDDIDAGSDLPGVDSPWEDLSKWVAQDPAGKYGHPDWRTRAIAISQETDPAYVAAGRYALKMQFAEVGHSETVAGREIKGEAAFSYEPGTALDLTGYQRLSLVLSYPADQPLELSVGFDPGWQELPPTAGPTIARLEKQRFTFDLTALKNPGAIERLTIKLDKKGATEYVSGAIYVDDLQFSDQPTTPTDGGTDLIADNAGGDAGSNVDAIGGDLSLADGGQ